MALTANYGFKAKKRLAGTVDAIRRELSTGPWLYRYSGAEQEEGAFLACTFWLVEAYANLGRTAEAETLMEEALSSLPAGAGVLTEMIDIGTGNLVGDLPQGLSHLAIINAATALDA